MEIHTFPTGPGAAPGERSSASPPGFHESAYDEMSTSQRNSKIGKAIEKPHGKPIEKPRKEAVEKAEAPLADAQSPLEEVECFQRDSLAGKYYAPFGINSMNFRYIPEKTTAWFEGLGDLLTQSARLSQQGDHAQAVACFRVLYELIEDMCRGKEIVFAKECGTWMIPIDQKKPIAAYLVSLAATSTPEEYAAAVLPLLQRDACESFSKGTYSVAIHAGDKAQGACLQEEVERRRIRVKPQ